ncbi:hypothetical protein BDA96_09G210900 [Sorghum bicolor]|uniref:Uncharacterized protein n=1 Tax=Sorghum bicolor TaxID=4558 RepID=A0A921QBR2_SORBI|nr:hypothetical protein BDA96_09G210900 [Sorghum bicolor]
MAAKRRKRSVAELFAAVPRVPRGGGHQGSGKGKKAAKRRKAEKDKGKLVLAVTVKTKKKKKVPAGVDVREKEKNSGVKVTSIRISKSFQHSIKNREPKNSSFKKKEKQEVSVLLDKKSKKGNRKSVLERHKKDMTNSVQAQSICKNLSKAGFSTVLNTTDMRCKSSSCKSKHVTFSDGTVKFGRTTHLPEENTKQPQSVQTFEQPTQEGRDHHNTDEQQLVYQQAEAISGSVETTSSLSENLVPAAVCRTIPLTKPKDITILGNSVDLNHCIEASHGSTCLNSASLACLSSKVPCQSFKGVDSHLNGDNSLSVDVECLGEQNHMVSQASFNPVSLAAKAVSGDRSPLSQPSGSCLYDRSRSTFQERAVAFSKVSSELVRSGNMVRSISSSTGSNKPAQAADCISACRNNHNRDDYVGLPINSRGEFVKIHPGSTPNSVDIFRRQCLGEKSSCPSASPTIFSPITCMDHVNLRPSYHARQICAIDQSVFHADPHFTATAPMAYRTDVRQLPNSERTKIHYYTTPSNKYPCTKQQELSMECFCSECLGHHNPEQKLLGMRNSCLSQNFGQDTQHNAETTMRLMGKTVTLGTSSIHCRRLNIETPCSSKQSQAENQFFQGTRTKVFPQLFLGGLVYPPSTFSDGERQPSGNLSHFSFVPAAVRAFVPGTSSFRTNGRNQQPELATANNPYVQPVDWRNENELGNQQPVMANQVQSNAEDMLLGSIYCRNTQTVAPESSFNTRSSARNFMEKGPASYQSSYLTQQQFSNMAPRTTASSFASGYAVQKAPGLTTQTKFTSLRPLPPSVFPSQVFSADYAPSHGAVTTFHPSVPTPYPVSNSNAPGNAVFGIESMRWTMMGSRPEGLEHLRNCKRPAETDDFPMTLPKKPCTAAQKGLHVLPFAETGLELRGSRPDVQPQSQPICLDDEDEADLRLGNTESHPAWSKAVSTLRPVKLNPGAKHVQHPSANQENPWPVHSITPPLAPGE